MSPAVRAHIRALAEEGLEIRQCAPEEFGSLVRLDTGQRVHGVPGEEGCVATIVGPSTFAASHEGRVVGWLWEIETYADDAEAGTPRTMGGCIPEVIPAYRRRGIGRVLYHLGMAEVVRLGARFGWTATSIHSPARRIYRAIGYAYWYLAFNLMYLEV